MARKVKDIYQKQSPAPPKAIEAVKSNEMSEQYGVKKSTLGDHLSGKITTGSKIGRNTVFPIEVEKQLVAKAQSVAEQGFGISRKQLICKAGRLAKTMELKTPFKGGVPGQAWLDGFFARNNELVLRKPEMLNIRARNLNPITLQKYFVDLRTILTDLNLKKNGTWMKMECQWNIHHQTYVLEREHDESQAEYPIVENHSPL